MMAFALHDLGEDDHARRWARVAAAFEPDDPRATYNIGCIHAVLGEIDTALALLRKTIALGISDQKIAWIHYQDHDWASLRGDARFEELFADPGITGNGASR
jgi:adenylate cyclase